MRLWGLMGVVGLLGCSGNTTIVEAAGDDGDAAVEMGDARAGSSEPDAGHVEGDAASAADASPSSDSATEFDSGHDSAAEPDACPFPSCDGRACGSVTTCGGTIVCGSCDGNQQCGGAGVEGQCGTYWPNCDPDQPSSNNPPVTCVVDLSAPNPANGSAPRWCASSTVTSYFSAYQCVTLTGTRVPSDCTDTSGATAVGCYF